MGRGYLKAAERAEFRPSMPTHIHTFSLGYAMSDKSDSRRIRVRVAHQSSDIFINTSYGFRRHKSYTTLVLTLSPTFGT